MPRDTETGQPAKGLRTSAHRLPVALPASNRGAARLHRSSGHGHWLASIEGERPTEGLHRLPLAAPELRLHRTEGAAHGCTGCHRRAASIWQPVQPCAAPRFDAAGAPVQPVAAGAAPRLAVRLRCWQASGRGRSSGAAAQPLGSMLAKPLAAGAPTCAAPWPVGRFRYPVAWLSQNPLRRAARRLVRDVRRPSVGRSAFDGRCSRCADVRRLRCWQPWPVRCSRCSPSVPTCAAVAGAPTCAAFDAGFQGGRGRSSGAASGRGRCGAAGAAPRLAVPPSMLASKVAVAGAPVQPVAVAGAPTSANNARIRTPGTQPGYL